MIHFNKYQGTGNDFIIIDNRDNRFNKETAFIRHLCDRRFGIGADGLMLVEKDKTADFKMVYYNSDGNESTMCGNGGRCIVAFAYRNKIITKKNTIFSAIDGLHDAEVLPSGDIRLKMIDVLKVDETPDGYFLNTGSPHVVQFSSDVASFPVFEQGEKVRYSETYRSTNGTNVNFTEITDSLKIIVRTYERGVEDETLSCGTGVTAAAIAYSKKEGIVGEIGVEVTTLGGKLDVFFEKSSQGYTNVWLSGAATFVFEGTI